MAQPLYLSVRVCERERSVCRDEISIRAFTILFSFSFSDPDSLSRQQQMQLIRSHLNNTTTALALDFNC